MHNNHLRIWTNELINFELDKINLSFLKEREWDTYSKNCVIRYIPVGKED